MRALVTGGTGLIGSNICRRLVESGDEVVALVRPGSDSEPLRAIGVHLSDGDVRSAASMRSAADGCDVIVNSAALLGGAVQEDHEHALTNHDGALNVYDVGAAVGARVVTLGSTPYLDHSATLTEESPIARDWHDDPYTRSKGMAYVEAKRRAEEDGADIVTVIPGATFGPGSVLSRAVGPTSFNRTLRAGVNGRIAEYISYPAPWVAADDVAAVCVAAAKVGRRGRTYLAFGVEDARTTAAWLNAGCAAAEVGHRVAELRIADGQPVPSSVIDRYGATQVGLAMRRFPEPWFDASVTRSELGVEPAALTDRMAETIAWLRANGQLRD